MIKKYNIKKFLSNLNKKNIILYGYGTIGQILEEYILKYRKDLNIIAIIDNFNTEISTLQNSIKTITFNQFLSKKFTNYEVIICNDIEDVILSIKNNLLKSNIKFLDKTITRQDLQYTIPQKFIFLFTFILPLLMIKETTVSFKNIIKALITSKWKCLSGNTTRIAYNNLYYYTQAYNFTKFGRYGISNLLSEGYYELKKFFYTTPISLKIQYKIGTVFMMFFAMCFWIISWIIMYHTNESLPIILFVTFFSTLFFAVFIEQQNYNILGWMLFPIFLTYLLNTNYIILTIILFFISLFSFTAFFIASIIIFVSFIYNFDYYLLFVVIPGAIKAIIPIIISLIDTKALATVAGGIGIHNKVKYNRRNHKTLNINKKYILGLILQFALIYVINTGFNQVSLIVLLISILFIINELISRFADQQSFYIAYLSVAIFALLNTNFNLISFISFVISIYPVYKYLMNMQCTTLSPLTPGIKTPYNVESLVNDLTQLYKPIPSNSKLFVAYKNPKGEYSNIFNGYRWFNEPIQYVANINNISLYPDWYMVFDNNEPNSPEDFWVDSIDEIYNYMIKKNVTYVIIPHFLYNNQALQYFKLLGEYQLEYKERFIIKKYKIYLMELKNA